MRIGTTPTHYFDLPFSSDVIEGIEIVYCLDDKEIVTKTKSDCTLDGNTVSVKLTQEETFKFKDCEIAEIQMRVSTSDGTVMVSDIKRVTCKRCLFDEVMK